MAKPKNAKETPTFYTHDKAEKALLKFAKRHGLKSKTKAQAKIVRDRLASDGLISRDDAERMIK